MYKVARMKNGRARGKQKGERRGRDRAEGGAGLRRAAQKKSALIRSQGWGPNSAFSGFSWATRIRIFFRAQYRRYGRSIYLRAR